MKDRVDAKKNKAKIVKEVLKDPLLSQREIADRAGLGKTTVQEHLKSLKTTKDERIIGITDNDIEIVELCQEGIMDKLKNKTEDIKARDMSAIARESSARYTIFRGEITDEHGGAKSLKDLSTEELLKMYNNLDKE